MALKPRTVRRLILLGSVGCILVLGLFGYFVVRPWQRQNTLDQLQTDGMAAAQEGQHDEAVALLGRYLRSSPNADPEYYLAFARSRLAFQARDGGHVIVAIQNYRNYLKENPSDTQAALELLPLFNRTSQWVEAKTLAESLINDEHIETPAVLRELRIANENISGQNEAVGELYAQAANHPDAEFEDVYEYVVWLLKQDRSSEAQEFVEQRIAEHGSTLDDRFLLYWIEDKDLYDTDRFPEQLEKLADAIGLDPQTGTWGAKPDALDSGLVHLCANLFNQYGRADLSLMLRKRSLEVNGSHDKDSIHFLARRLFWRGEYDDLLEMDYRNDEGERFPELVAYQSFALDHQDKPEESAKKVEELDDIKFDFRGAIWSEMIAGMGLMKQDDATSDQIEEVYLDVKKAIEVYREPTITLFMGDLEYRRGNLDGAKEQWDRAQNIVVAESRSWEWIMPIDRVIHAYSNEGRLAEVGGYIGLLMQNAMAQNPAQATMLVFQTEAKLAQMGQVSDQEINILLDRYEQIVAQISPAERAIFASSVATMYASVGKRDQAQSTLVQAINETDNLSLINEMLVVDQIYRLGVAEAAGIDLASAITQSPESTLPYALREFGDPSQIDEGLKIFEDGIASSTGDEQYRWQVAKVQYLDQLIPAYKPDAGQGKDSRARAAWEALAQAYPKKTEVLYLMAESQTYSQDVAAIDGIIERVNGVSGGSKADISSRLELAKAAAIVGRDSITRSKRDQALAIVRSVLAKDSNNINARNMLGRLYSLRSSPEITDPNERFMPQYDLAIDEYIAIARLTRGRGALDYYFSAIRLSVESGKDDQAMEFLDEVTPKFEHDPNVQMVAAGWYEQLGDPDRAIQNYGRIYANVDDHDLKIDAGLSLAKLSVAQGDRSVALRILKEIEQAETLNDRQLYRLASLYAKNGYPEEGGLVASNGEQYGIDKIDAMLTNARYAAAYDQENYEPILREIVAQDQTNEDAWSMLVKHLLNEDRPEEAQELLAKAIELNPDNEQLTLLSLVTSGKDVTVTELIESGAIESDDLMRKIAARADAYVAAKTTSTPAQQQAMIIELIQDFPNVRPLQQYLAAELAAIPGVSPEVIAQYIGQMARRFPSDSAIMGAACKAKLQIGKPLEAIDLANIWKSNMVGSPMSADLVIAQGEIQLERFSKASRILRPYLDFADEHSNEPVSAETLYAYCYAQLLDGEDPKVSSTRLEGLLADPQSLSRSVWVKLAANAVPDEASAVAWMERVTPDLLASEKMFAAEQWLGLIKRFNADMPAYAQAAIDLIGEVDSVQSGNIAQSSMLADAYGILGKSLTESSKQQAAFDRAISLLDELRTVEPQNPIYLAKSASFAQQAGNWQQAQARYRELLAMNVQSVPFVASIQNNLAVLIERHTEDPTELQEALKLSQSASEAVGIGSFFGSRGWIELKLGMLAEAERSFDRCVASQPDSLEGWVGLAVVRFQGGESRQEEARQAFGQVQTLSQSEDLSPYLREKLRSMGNPDWQLSEVSTSS